MAPFKMHYEQRMGSRCSGWLLSRTPLFLDRAQAGYKPSPNFSSRHIWAGMKAEKHGSRVRWDLNHSLSAPCPETRAARAQAAELRLQHGAAGGCRDPRSVRARLARAPWVAALGEDACYAAPGPRRRRVADTGCGCLCSTFSRVNRISELAAK